MVANLCTRWIYFFILCISVALHVNVGDKVNIKIVEEPSNYGMMNNLHAGGGSLYESDAKKLKMRINPSSFSGPALFQRLVGKCFTLIDDTYKYEFCPFSNVTQHEQSLRWNPYSGILGVWQEWEIVNNTFIAMVMREGDRCGQNFRTVRVTFKCDQSNSIVNVSEPSTCNYHLVLKTPYVCHKHAMLVYPTLSTELRDEWDSLRGELDREEITKKGYDKGLKKIFVKAGYCLSDETKNKVAFDAVEKEKQAEKEKAASTDFVSLYQCTEEYNKLKKEFEEVKHLLEEKILIDEGAISSNKTEDKKPAASSKDNKDKPEEVQLPEVLPGTTVKIPENIPNEL